MRLDLRTCAECGGPLPPPGKRGPARRLCSERCKKRAQRRKRAEWATFEPWEPDPSEDRIDYHVGVEARRRELLETVLAMGRGRMPASPEDRVARGLIELRQLVFTIRRAGVELAPGARGPVEAFAIEVGQAFDRLEGLMHPKPPGITPK